MKDKNAFQWDAYRPLIDRIPESASRGVWSRGVSAPGGGIPACTEADPPPLTESQTPVKTLPWPNFVAAGKNYEHFNVLHAMDTFKL